MEFYAKESVRVISTDGSKIRYILEIRLDKCMEENSINQTTKCSSWLQKGPWHYWPYCKSMLDHGKISGISKHINICKKADCVDHNKLWRVSEGLECQYIWSSCAVTVHKWESHLANNIWGHFLVQNRERSMVRLHYFTFLFQHICQSDYMKAGSWRIKRYNKD